MNDAALRAAALRGRRMSEDEDLARFPVWSASGNHLAVQLRRNGSSIAMLPGPKILVTGGEN
jgi:hypothetical protein